MTSLLGRSLGFTGALQFQRGETDRRARELCAAPQLLFDGSLSGSSTGRSFAHAAGVNCLSIEPFRSRFLLSGGADATISLWDLDQDVVPSEDTVHHPIGHIPKSPQGHQYGITALSFYPIDPGAFISSSYDKTVHVWDTETLQSAISFPLPGQVYAHGISPIASHLLIAVAVQDSHVRLIDLDSGASTHTLPGHEGAVLSVAWSPVREHVLISSGSDGTVRLWDIRSAGNILGSLNHEDSVGILDPESTGRHISAGRRRPDAKAHVGPCNGAIFSARGTHIISCGHDERIRVWDASTGANTLVHFGPIVRNRVLASIKPTLVPLDVTEVGHELMLFPNGPELLLLDVHQGTLLHRLRPMPRQAARAKGETGLKQRVTDISWRPGHCEAYSAHSSGLLKAWIPDTGENDVVEREEYPGDQGPAQWEDELHEGGHRKRRREELHQLYRDLTKQKITFT